MTTERSGSKEKLQQKELEMKFELLRCRFVKEKLREKERKEASANGMTEAEGTGSKRRTMIKE